MAKYVQVKVYRRDGEWYASVWVNRVHKSTDPLEIPDASSDMDALNAAEEIAIDLSDTYEVSRVADVDDDGNEAQW